MMESENITEKNWPMATKILPEKSTSVPEKAFIPTPSDSGSDTNIEKAGEAECHKDGYMEFCKGYIDCAKESIRFLTEVEHLPVEHPLVVSLQDELHKRIQMVGFQMIIQGFFESETSDDSDSEYEEGDRVEKLGTSQSEVSVFDPETEKQSTGSLLNSKEEVDLATNIAEQIYGILYGDDRDDAESEESEESEEFDIDISLDEGFHSGQE